MKAGNTVIVRCFMTCNRLSNCLS